MGEVDGGGDGKRSGDALKRTRELLMRARRMALGPNVHAHTNAQLVHTSIFQREWIPLHITSAVLLPSSFYLPATAYNSNLSLCCLVLCTLYLLRSTDSVRW